MSVVTLSMSGAEPKPLTSPSTTMLRPSTTMVAPSASPASMYDDTVAMGPGDQRAHVRVAGAVTGLQRSCPVRDLGDQFVGDVTDGDKSRDGHASFTSRTEARIDHRVGGKVEVGVGQDDRMVLGAAECLDTLAVQGAGGQTYTAIGVEPTTELTADRRVGEQFVDSHLVALQNVENAAGKPASAQSSAIQSAAVGSFSDGLSTTVLPAAMATGKNHISTSPGS